MKNTKLLLLILFVLSSQLLLSQDKHITYLGDVFYIDLASAAHKDSTVKHYKEKDNHHILVFEDKKAILFRKEIDYTRRDSMIFNNYKRYYPTLFDKKKEASRHLSLLHNYSTGDIFANNRHSPEWKKITPLEDPELFKQEKNYIVSYYKDSLDISFHPPEIKHTGNTKTIKGYLCKNAIVVKGKRTYDVWYTEEIDYHWCFDDYNYLLLGTPIMIYYEGEPYLEFVSIEDIDYNKIPIDNYVVDFVLKNWNKKIK